MRSEKNNIIGRLDKLEDRRPVIKQNESTKYRRSRLLQPASVRADLVHSVSLAPSVPVVTGLSHDVRDLALELLRVLEDTPDKAGAQVPRNVAVEGLQSS